MSAPKKVNEESIPMNDNSPITEYQKHVKQVLNQRYTAIAKRLDTETNIINRYELKLSLESILEDYKALFPEG